MCISAYDLIIYIYGNSMVSTAYFFLSHMCTNGGSIYKLQKQCRDMCNMVTIFVQGNMPVIGVFI